MRVTTLRSEPFSSNVHVVEVGEAAMVVDAPDEHGSSGPSRARLG